MSSIPAVLEKMLEEVKDPKYQGKSDEDIAILLNKKEEDEWWRHHKFCPEDVVRMRAYSQNASSKVSSNQPAKKHWWS
jgi:hypothetical protein